jgi:endonuclease/exonuclease/phosphatase family metal-dependent hydrolase
MPRTCGREVARVTWPRLLTAWLVVVLAACSPATTDTPAPPATPPVGNETFSLLQMNLCLSGLAPCMHYPEVIGEAITVIRERRPDVVTLNEVCSGDVARLARRTGYHQRFSTVHYDGRPLPCRDPSGRGVFGNAVLAAAQITATVDHHFNAQSIDLEERRWLCVETTDSLTVCTTHLSSQSEIETAVRQQCAEFSHVLAKLARRGATIAAGDMNNVDSCAPTEMWTVTDQGVQHVYGSGDRDATSEVMPATYTDHGFLYVRARLASPARGPS